jgi:hypothetical protein
MKSRVKLKKQFLASPRKFYKSRPISPGTVIAVREDNPGPHRSLMGMILRVGYYSKQDGTNVIWLVNPDGKYVETTDHRLLNRHFTVITVSEETDVFGANRPQIGSL